VHASRRRRAPGSAREVAYRCLLRIDHDGAYANLLVPAALTASSLDGRDRGFVTELVYGTTRMRRACDALVDRFLLREPDDELRSLLRLGAYQLEFAGVPAHAAVGETTELAPKRAKGFVNAILRRVAATPMVWPDDATRLSYPDWIVARLVAELGETDALAALERMDRPAPVTDRGDGYVQDLASQWVAAAVGARAGDRILDACAAPGGKATAMAATGAFVVAGDASPARTRLVAGNAARLGADVSCVVADASVPAFAAAAFDRVLVDAPCSGLGTLRRRADARWRVVPADVDELARLQASILDATAPLVRTGGTLVYSVCTLTAAESIDHPTPAGFVVDEAPPPAATGVAWRRFGKGWRLLPHDVDTDGMVVVRYRRTP
jgi:16S rRNA (cytosine967-C5)-methyltransferase